MSAKISKCGNSQGSRVPKDIMENLHLPKEYKGKEVLSERIGNEEW